MSPTLGAAIVLTKYPVLLLAVVVVGVLAVDIEPALDYAIPDSSSAGNRSANGLKREEIRDIARAAKDEKEQATSNSNATARVFQVPSDERAKAGLAYAATKEEENKHTAYQNALQARQLAISEVTDQIRFLKEEKKEAEEDGDGAEVGRIKARLTSLKRKRDELYDSEMPTPPAAAK